MDAFNRLDQVITDISQKNYFKEGEIEKAQKNIAIEYDNLKTNSLRTYMGLVTRFRFSNDENYITNFLDSINIVDVEHMHRYIGDYFTDHHGVRSLVASIDSMKKIRPDQQYFVLDESIDETKFTYDLNKTDIETDEATQSLQRVIQWLYINPDINVQINGFSDEGEFMKSYDDSVLRFIDSTATFHKAMPDATKKGYLRIEFMRAMKIAKALYEAGIGEDRISGTSMVFTSDTKEAAAANRKCTLTFEKIQPRVSLYEYHFGKKKDEQPHN
jgi:outer membrane protein OmpA-like peptidoglycan-associated protein